MFQQPEMIVTVDVYDVAGHPCNTKWLTSSGRYYLAMSKDDAERISEREMDRADLSAEFDKLLELQTRVLLQFQFCRAVVARRRTQPINEKIT